VNAFVSSLVCSFLTLCSLALPAQQQLSQDEQVRKDAELALQRAIEEAGNDRAALVRNLEEYLQRFPDTPRKVAIYRALVEAAMQLRDVTKALDYAERIIALRPDDSSMLLYAVDLLEQMGGEQHLLRAAGYVTRVLDRIEKSPETEKPERISHDDWKLEQKKLLMSVYLIRGRLEMQRRNYERAGADLAASYALLATPAAALRLGEIAEVQKDYGKAIDYYTVAFVLPDTYSTGIDRREVRRKLGNAWRILHNSEAGLGEHLLAAYDRLTAEDTRSVARPNSAATDLFAFTVRRLNGPPLQLTELKGKILVLIFWATWCLPCRELEPLIEKVEQDFAGNDEVMFLAANADEDEERVKPYVERHKLRSTVVFEDGLGRFFQVSSIPTVIVLDRSGKIVYRSQGFLPEGFMENLAAAIRRALAATAPTAP